MSGTSIAQLVPIALQPILRRVYTPEDFGVYSVYLSIVGILVVVSSLKYELAIVLPDDDQDAANIVFLAILFNLAISCVILLLIAVLHPRIIEMLHIPSQYSGFLYFVPLSVLFFGFYQSINFWLIRKKAFLPLSLNKFMRRGGEGGAQLTLGAYHFPYALFIGDLLGHLINILFGIFQGIRTGLKLNLISISRLGTVSARYAEFPKYSVFPSLMSACSYLLPTIMINSFFSAEYAGYYDLSKLLLSIPPALLSASVSNVLLQRISEKVNRNESFIKELLPVLFLILFLSVLEIAIIKFTAIELFGIFFGAKWIFSGKISTLLVWAFASHFIVTSFTSMFIAMHKIKLLSIWQILSFFSILSLYFFRNLSFMGFLEIMVLIDISRYLLILGIMTMIVVKYEKQFR